MQPRKCNGLQDFYATELLLVLEGVYRLDYLDYISCGYEPGMIDALLLVPIKLITPINPPP